jgi:hypothetical protein
VADLGQEHERKSNATHRLRWSSLIHGCWLLTLLKVSEYPVSRAQRAMLQNKNSFFWIKIL